MVYYKLKARDFQSCDRRSCRCCGKGQETMQTKARRILTAALLGSRRIKEQKLIILQFCNKKCFIVKRCPAIKIELDKEKKKTQKKEFFISILIQIPHLT